MFSGITLNKDVPVYKQIKNYIKHMVMEGLLQSGEKLPSTRELSRVLNVSRNTVINAYEALEEEGIVSIVRGKGSFIQNEKKVMQHGNIINWDNMINAYGRKCEAMDLVKHEAVWKKGMISFKSISPDTDLFDMEDVKRAFLNRISIEGNKILNYGYAKGYEPLIQYISKYMRQKGIDMDEKDILITNGFTEGFDIIMSSLFKKGDEIICENPTHSTAIKIMRLYDLIVNGIDMEYDGVNLDSLKRTIDKGNIKAAFFIPSYHNPTGIVMSYEKRLHVFKILEEYKIPLIEDGFNEELRYSGDHIGPMSALYGKGNGAIYIGSFSKILFPGIRVGWICADRRLINILESVKRSRNIHTSTLDQAVFYQYLMENNFERYIKKVRKVYSERYNFAVQCINYYMPCKKILGEGGLHVFIYLNDNMDSRLILEECCRRDVIFTPGDIFFTDNKGKNTLRLGFSRTKIDEIEKGIKIIGDVISESLANS